MAIPDLLTWLDQAGCTITKVEGVPDHVLVKRARAFVADALVIYLALNLPLPPPATTVMDRQVEVSMPPARGTT